ncbi:hypothetical protein lbkm_0514 [Lachnospiraceae bacterium KM106-2]|nr:hypothetical protein lbkm_0514 [Lachnospiraceae bacterium KM106-2]
MDLIHLLTIAQENKKAYAKVIEYVISNPVIMYAEFLAYYIRMYIENEQLDSEELYRIGVVFAMKSKNYEVVKLGIIILGQYDDSVAKNLIRILGLHSEFTQIALESSKYFVDRNGFAFDLLCSTSGYGKLSALNAFHPVNEHLQRWMMEDGYINEITNELCACNCLNKTEIIMYSKKIIFSEQTFSKYSRLLLYGLSQGDRVTLKNSMNLITAYLKAVDLYAKKYVDLAAICMICYNLKKYPTKIQGQEKEDDYSQEWMEVLAASCLPLVGKFHADKLVIAEVKKEKYPLYAMFAVIEVCGLSLPFEVYEKLLQRHPYELVLLDYLLGENADKYWYSVYEAVYPGLPQEVFEYEPMLLYDLRMNKKYWPDLWLYYLLLEMNRRQFGEETLLYACLKARYQENRRQAMIMLKNHMEYMDDQMRAYLRVREEEETDCHLKDEISQIIRPANG